MCTVTFVPRPTGFLPAMNRDVVCSHKGRTSTLERTPTGGVSGEGGKNWRAIEQEFPDHAEVFALAMAEGRLYAGLYSKGLYAWNEQQQRWSKVGHVLPLVLAAIDGTLIAGHNPVGLHWSGDLGVSWSKETSAMPDVPGELSSEAPVWELSSNDEVVITGASDGICRSEDRGWTWTRARTGLSDECPGISFLVKAAFVLAATPVKGAHDEAAGRE